MGLEPTRYYYHKILSLARLPVPTLPPLPVSRLNRLKQAKNTIPRFVSFVNLSLDRIIAFTRRINYNLG